MGQVPIDLVGIPEYFFEHNELEDAGNGLVRIVRYIKRHSIIVPVCSTVSPVVSVLKLGQDAEAFARKMLLETCTVGH